MGQALSQALGDTAVSKTDKNLCPVREMMSKDVWSKVLEHAVPSMETDSMRGVGRTLAPPT